MESKLNLDLNLVAKARESSKNIAQDTQTLKLETDYLLELLY